MTRSQIVTLAYLFAMAALGLLVAPVFADVGIVVWIDEGSAFRKANLEVEMAQLRALDPRTEFRVIYLKAGSVTKGMQEQLPGLLRTGEKVSHLVISTHGRFDKKLGETQLREFGGFGKAGALGELKTLLDHLGERRLFAEDLHLYLNACSTFCDGAPSFNARARALTTEIRNFGVKRVSLWGAKQPTFGGELMPMTKARQLRSLLTDSVSVVAAGISVLTIAGVSYVLAHRSELPNDLFGQTMLLSPLSLAYAARAMMSIAQVLVAGTTGYLVTAEGPWLHSREVDLVEEAATARVGLLCDASLKRPPPAVGTSPAP